MGERTSEDFARAADDALDGLHARLAELIPVQLQIDELRQRCDRSAARSITTT